MKKSKLVPAFLMVLPLIACSSVATSTKISNAEGLELLENVASSLSSNKVTKYTDRSHISSSRDLYSKLPVDSVTDYCYYDGDNGFVNYQTIDPESYEISLSYLYVKEASLYSVVKNEYSVTNYESTALALAAWTKQAEALYSPKGVTARALIMATLYLSGTTSSSSSSKAKTLGAASSTSSSTTSASEDGGSCYKDIEGDGFAVYYKLSESASNMTFSSNDEITFKNGLVTTDFIDTKNTKTDKTYNGLSMSHEYTYGVAAFTYPDINNMTIMNSSSSSASLPS